MSAKTGKVESREKSHLHEKKHTHTSKQKNVSGTIKYQAQGFP